MELKMYEVAPPKDLHVVVPAGKYVLGDPCYSVPDEDWHMLLESCEYFEKPIGTVNGVQVLAFRTMYGDGEYKDNMGNKYGVDAGLIGLVPLEYADLTQINWGKEGPVIVEFKLNTHCYMHDESGMLEFGAYKIPTGNDAYEYNTYEEEEE